ncbi:MAG TPA: hypothetical protein VD963_02215 [Phycisphaerales bacterium]|nr:hypothetical protein [Phycisphaerales bacterium]
MTTSGDGELVLLVGHCVPDSALIRSGIRRAAPDARVERVNDADELRDKLPGARLVLVNRVLVGEFATESGVELIGSIAQQSAAGGPVVMLVSDQPQAQRQAERAGASPGFGKSAVHAPETTRLLADVLAPARKE